MQHPSGVSDRTLRPCYTSYCCHCPCYLTDVPALYDLAMQYPSDISEPPCYSPYRCSCSVRSWYATSFRCFRSHIRTMLLILLLSLLLLPYRCSCSVRSRYAASSFSCFRSHLVIHIPYRCSCSIRSRYAASSFSCFRSHLVIHIHYRCSCSIPSWYAASSYRCLRPCYTTPYRCHCSCHLTNVSEPRENENLITSFIDASTVYGSTIQRQQRLRDSSKSKANFSGPLILIDSYIL